MAKKPRLTLVGDQTKTAATSLPPPTTLKDTGAKLWKTVMSEYAIQDSGGLEILRQLCQAADRAAECADAIARDGAVVRTKTGPKEHPLLKIELAARSFVVRSLGRLNLDVEPLKAVGRPGSFPGWSGTDANE
jgi:hypothetical protein